MPAGLPYRLLSRAYTYMQRFTDLKVWQTGTFAGFGCLPTVPGISCYGAVRSVVPIAQSRRIHSHKYCRGLEAHGKAGLRPVP